MISAKYTESFIKDVYEKNVLSTSAKADERILTNVRETLEQTRNARSVTSQPSIWRTVMENRAAKFGMIAAVLAVIFGVPALTLFSRQKNSASDQWWLGPQAAWAGEITASLESVKALVYREQPVFVKPFGSTHISGNWTRCYQARDRFRRDKYYHDKLVDVTWEVPDGNDLLHYMVSHEYECYQEDRRQGAAYDRDPVEQLLFYVRLLHKADRILESKLFDGKECVGFEISAAKYGNNPEGRIDRIWFDVESKLPVRIERHGLPLTNHPEETLTLIQDQFEYHVDVPAEMFTPQIPGGYVNTHPDSIRKAREKEEKGQMFFTEVPAGLKEQVIAALENVKTAVYREAGPQTQKVYFSRYAWRIDVYAADHVQCITWYVVNKNDWGKTSFDFNDEGFRLTQTTVNYEDRAYRVSEYRGEPRPHHPMDSIMSLIGYLDRADRQLDNMKIEGIDCLGFELSAKKYGTNPDTMKHRLWFDVQTKLPVRMEWEWVQEDGSHTRVQDHFEWNRALPDDTFVPKVPDGFVKETDQ